MKTLKTAFGAPSCVNACWTVRPVAEVPSPKFQVHEAALASAALKVTSWPVGTSQRPEACENVAPEIV